MNIFFNFMKVLRIIAFFWALIYIGVRIRRYYMMEPFQDACSKKKPVRGPKDIEFDISGWGVTSEERKKLLGLPVHREAIDPPPTAYHNHSRMQPIDYDGLNIYMIRASDVERPEFCPCCGRYRTVIPTLISLDEVPLHPEYGIFAASTTSLTNVRCEACEYEWFVFKKPLYHPYK